MRVTDIALGTGSLERSKARELFSSLVAATEDRKIERSFLASPERLALSGIKIIRQGKKKDA